MKTSILFKYYLADSIPCSKLIAHLDEGKCENYFENSHFELLVGYSCFQKAIHSISNHPSYIKIEHLLDCQLRKNAHKIIPLFFDHFLRANWEKYSEIPFSQYCQSLDSFYLENERVMPFKGKKNFQIMRREGWLEELKTINGTHRLMKQQTKYHIFNVKLEYSINSLIEHYSIHQEYFLNL